MMQQAPYYIYNENQQCPLTKRHIAVLANPVVMNHYLFEYDALVEAFKTQLCNNEDLRCLVTQDTLEPLPDCWLTWRGVAYAFLFGIFAVAGLYLSWQIHNFIREKRIHLLYYLWDNFPDTGWRRFVSRWLTRFCWKDFYRYGLVYPVSFTAPTFISGHYSAKAIVQWGIAQGVISQKAVSHSFLPHSTITS